VVELLLGVLEVLNVLDVVYTLLLTVAAFGLDSLVFAVPPPLPLPLPLPLPHEIMLNKLAPMVKHLAT
jgi:hypothetical protein